MGKSFEIDEVLITFNSTGGGDTFFGTTPLIIFMHSLP